MQNLVQIQKSGADMIFDKIVAPIVPNEITSKCLGKLLCYRLNDWSGIDTNVDITWLLQELSKLPVTIYKERSQNIFLESFKLCLYPKDEVTAERLPELKRLVEVIAKCNIRHLRHLGNSDNFMAHRFFPWDEKTYKMAVANRIAVFLQEKTFVNRADNCFIQ